VNETIHDFFGFPEALYQIRYPAPGAPWMVDRVSELLGGSVERNAKRGLDHGAWVPLRLIFPEADVPVVQLSLQSGQGPDHHYRMGQALAALRREGVLIVGSGSFTHDLSSFRQYHDALHAPAPEWVDQFADWMSAALEQGRVNDLLDYRSRAPHAARNHPTPEHLLPLFVAAGAAEGEPVAHLHRSTTHGILRMDAFAFGDAR
jgi:4,5-DOPA dioxygenase extradiol